MSPRLFLRELKLRGFPTTYYHEKQNRGLGSEFIRVVDASLANIQRNLLAYPLIYKQVHRKLVRRFPYAIFYYF